MTCLNKQVLGFLGVAAHVKFVRLLGFNELIVCLVAKLLSLSQVRVALRVNVIGGPFLREQNSYAEER
jgi:hypothetical protein